MRSVTVPSTGVPRGLRFICLLSASALLAACSVNSDRFNSLTSTQSTQATPPIVDPLPPASAATTGAGEQYNRSVSGSSLGNVGALPRGTVADGSGRVTVNRGDTLYSIARANNVHVKDLIATNNLQAPYHLSAGQRISLPREANGNTRVASNSAYSPQPTYAEPKQTLSSDGSHRVKAGETLYSLGRTYNVHPKQIASLNGLSAPYGLNVGQTVQIPAGTGASAFPSTAGKVASLQTPSAAKPAADRVEQRTAKVDTSDLNSTKSDRDSIAKEKTEKIQPLPQPTKRASSRFRWPLKGRVISSFGPKPSGSRNDGINIAVPEGTNVLSAENGVVAYAGNELKGYGNLILIRHDGGWVTAYAHNKELFVKRGDRVSRGKVIAKAGSTGSVNSPQLHFEIRKGADAVDPMKYLGSSKVAGG